jgi:hypothetical protein
MNRIEPRRTASLAAPQKATVSIAVGVPIAEHPPAQIAAGVFHASYVLEHIRCEMWSSHLCGVALVSSVLSRAEEQLKAT